MKDKNNITSTNRRITALADTIQKARAKLSADNQHISLSPDETRRIILFCIIYFRVTKQLFISAPICLQSALKNLNAPDSRMLDLHTIKAAGEIELTGALTELSRIAQDSDWYDLINYALESLEYDIDEYFKVKISRGTRSSNSKKKGRGIYYTPIDVVDFMVSKCVSQVLHSVTKPTVLDCSCGSGVFLLHSLLYLERAYNPKHDLDVSIDILKQYIWGVDISQAAVDCCKTVFIQYYIANYENATSRLDKIWDTLNNSIFVGDATHLKDVFAVNPSLPSFFDCILGNPPYVTEGKDSNLFIPFVDNMMLYSSKRSCSALILPLSICYSRGREFVSLRNKIHNDNVTWSFMNYDRSPDSLFGDQVKTRNTILFRSNIEQTADVFTTNLQRWTSANRKDLFTNYSLCGISGLSISKCVPKISNTIERAGYEYISSGSSNLSSLFKRGNTDYPLIVNGTAYNWLCVYDHIPPSTDESEKTYISATTRIYYLPDRDSRDFCIAILSNRIAYWFWSVVGDGFHFNASFLSDFKVSKNTFTKAQYEKLCCLGRTYSEQIKTYPTVSYNAGKKIVNYSHWEAMDTVRNIEKIIIDALNLSDNFASHIEQWYSNQVHCNRDIEKR